MSNYGECHIFFQVNSAVRTMDHFRQWLDLGIHTEACMTRPETCGAAGGAISLWIRIDNINFCRNDGGIMSTRARGLHTGTYIKCSYNIHNME